MVLFLHTGVANAIPAKSTPSPNRCEVLRPNQSFIDLMLTDHETSSSELRSALVIGNGAYRSINPLSNPKEDATAVAQLLQSLGFTVTLAIDTSSSEYELCERMFLEQYDYVDLAVIYYAGHGLQFRTKDANGKIGLPTNYMAFVDAGANPSRYAVGFRQTDPLIESITPKARNTLVFLDACRNNSFNAKNADFINDRTIAGNPSAGMSESSLESSDAFRGANILVSFAAAPNETAADGTGTHSPFSRAFISHADSPGISIDELMKTVAAEVQTETNGTQIPWVNSSLSSAVYLNGDTPLTILQQRSENWANKSGQLLDSGERDRAVAAALKGLPAGLSREFYEQNLRQAYEALRRAHVSRTANLSSSTSGVWSVSIGSKRAIAGTELWNTETNTLIVDLMPTDELQPALYKGPVLSGNGNRIAWLLSDGSIRVWTMKDGTELLYAPSSNKKFQRVALDHEGETLAAQYLSQYAEAMFAVWDVETGKLDSKFQLTNLPEIPAKQGVGEQQRLKDLSLEGYQLYGNRSMVHSLAVSPNGDKLITSVAPLALAGKGKTSKLELWDVKAGTRIAATGYIEPSLLALKFSPDQRFLISDSFSKTKNGYMKYGMSMWQADTLQLVWQHDFGSGMAINNNTVSFSPDSTSLAILAAGVDPLIFDVATGERTSSDKTTYEPNISYIFSGSQGQRGAVIYWDIKKPDLNIVDAALETLSATLKASVAQERLKYFPATNR